MAKKTGYVYIRLNKTKPGQPGIWKDSKRLEVVTTYAALGNLRLTAAQCNVPVPTVQYWMKQPWWKEYTEEIKRQENTELSASLRKVVDKSLEAVMDRLENGEYMYDPRTGDVRRVPAKLRDVHRVATDLIDKRQILEKNKPGEKETTKTIEDHLTFLAKQFADFASGRNEKVIEGDFNAIHEERKTGLQAGVSLGEVLEAEPSEGQGGEE